MAMETETETIWQILDRPNRSPDGRRRPGTWRPPPVASGPMVPPECETVLAKAARHLAAADPAKRAELARALLSNAKDTIGVLAVVTAGLLRGAGTASARAGFAAVLTSLGPVAVPAVLDAVWATRSVPATVALAGVLAEVGPALPVGDRTSLFMDIQIAAAPQTRTAAYDALMAAADAVRRR